MHFLRPETAQGIQNQQCGHCLVSARRSVPIDGKSFRNEITPGNFIFRTREFEQMEFEYLKLMTLRH